MQPAPAPRTITAIGDAAVRLIGVTKRFPQVTALDGVDLEIGAGQFVALLGPNGAGKTTAINLMLGLRHPTAGHVELLGAPPTDRAARTRCGVMLQESGVPVLLTVREIVALFSSHYPRPLPIASVLAMANLEDKARHRVGNLSGGERQRLYYAAAICGDPDVLFLDEPTVGMDVESRHRFYADLRAFSTQGKTILLTTHYLEEADQLAERVVVIDHGHVVVDGTPAEIKARVPGRHITVSAARPLTMADFADLPVRRLVLANHTASMLSNGPVKVVEALVGRSVPMTDLQVVGAALEDAFLALTGAESKP